MTFENKPNFKIVIPNSIASSDMVLTSAMRMPEVPQNTLTGVGTVDEGDLDCLYKPRLTAIYWMEQKKQKERDGNTEWATIDKYLLALSLVTGEDGDGKYVFTPLYLMADLFYSQEDGTYIAKALGSYSSIAKVVAVNAKNQGKVVAERDFRRDGVGELTTVLLADANLDKRAIPLFFWLQLNDVSFS